MEPELDLDAAAELLDRPHNPSFYPQHGDLARAFVSPLTGQQPADMSCELSQLEVPEADPEGLAAELASAFPSLLGENAAEVSEDGVVITVPEASETDQDLEWMLAHWSLAIARDYGVQSVEAGSHTWDRDSAAWKQEPSAQEALSPSASPGRTDSVPTPRRRPRRPEPSALSGAQRPGIRREGTGNC